MFDNNKIFPLTEHFQQTMSHYPKPECSPYLSYVLTDFSTEVITSDSLGTLMCTPSSS